VMYVPLLLGFFQLLQGQHERGTFTARFEQLEPRVSLGISH
jgi:hypothetical protein